MCEGGGHGHDHGDPWDRPRLLEDDRGHRLTTVGLDRVLSVARFVAAQPEGRRAAAGFIGYGATAPGDRALIAVDREYDPRIPEAVARALREKGARVDVITVDVGDDEVFDELDEIRVIMRREPWDRDPRRWEG